MTDTQFFAVALPWARTAHAALGNTVLVSVILAQWAAETGYGGPDWQPPRNNPGNVGNTTEGGQMDFPTLAAGVAAYVKTMKLGYYTAVRGAKGYVAQSLALGESPWAAAHYNDGGGPGSLLITIIQDFNLTKYDTTAPPPPPPIPVSTFLEMITMTNDLFLRVAYRLLLLRDPDEAGYDANLAALNNGSQSHGNIWMNIQDSPEGQDVQQHVRTANGL